MASQRIKTSLMLTIRMATHTYSQLYERQSLSREGFRGNRTGPRSVRRSRSTIVGIKKHFDGTEDELSVEKERLHCIRRQDLTIRSDLVGSA